MEELKVHLKVQNVVDSVAAIHQQRHEMPAQDAVIGEAFEQERWYQELGTEQSLVFLR